MTNSSAKQTLKNYTKSDSKTSLHTIDEESSFYLCMKAQKVSTSGLFKNDRVICVDKDTISYYSKVSSKCEYTLQEMQKQSPKLSFNHSELHSVEVNSSDSKMLIINVLGQIVENGKLKTYNTIQSLKFIFKNETDLAKYKNILEKIISNGKIVNRTISLEDQYISILHNF